MSKFNSEEEALHYMDDGVKEVIIPKGLINPNETTIIEIPEKMENVRTVIARPRSIPASSSAVLPNRDAKENFSKAPTDRREKQFCFNTTQTPISHRKLRPKSASKSKICDCGGTDVKCRNVQKHTKIQHDIEERAYDNNNTYYEAQTSHYPYYEEAAEKDLEYNKNPNEYESVLRKQAFSMYHQAPNRHSYHEMEQHQQYLKEDAYYAPPRNDPNVCQFCNKRKKIFKDKTHAQIEAVLSNLEALEFNRIQNDLKNFQNARRKIIFEATGFNLGQTPR